MKYSKKQNYCETARRYFVLVMLPVILLLSSCSKQGIVNLFGENNTKNRVIMKTNYILGPDDVVYITVKQHPEWTGEFSVDPDGKIMIPGLDEFRAEGLTKEEFAANISKYLENYINDPRVIIEIVQYISQSVYVMGQVNKPGKYSTEGKNITLRDAVINAGLPTRFAALGRVFIISPGQDKTTRKVVNLYRILYRGELENNVYLKPGNIVYVPKSLIGTVTDFLSTLLSPMSSVSAAKTIAEP